MREPLGSRQACSERLPPSPAWVGGERRLQIGRRWKERRGRCRGVHAAGAAQSPEEERMEANPPRRGGDGAAHTVRSSPHTRLCPSGGEGSQGRPDVPRGDPRRLRKHSPFPTSGTQLRLPLAIAYWTLVLGLPRDNQVLSRRPRSQFPACLFRRPGCGAAAGADGGRVGCHPQPGPPSQREGPQAVGARDGQAVGSIRGLLSP